MENFNAALWYTHVQTCIQIKQQNKKTELLLSIYTTSEFTRKDSKHTVEVPVHHVYCDTYSQ